MQTNIYAKTTKAFIEIQVSDIEAVQKFYQEIFGYKKIGGWDNGPQDKGVMLNTGSIIIELLQKGKPKNLIGIELSLEVADVAKLYESVKKIVPITEALHHNPWGDTSFSCTDPEGFTLTFYTDD